MSAGRLIFGIIIIAIGALFLLDNTVDTLNIGAVSQWWPMLLVLFGVWRLVADKFRKLFFPLLLIVIGALLQLRQLDLISGIDFGTYWPIILIAIGIAILAGGIRRRSRRNNRGGGHHGGHRAASSTVIDADAPSVTEGDSLDVTFSSDNKAVYGDFRSGNINIVMGSGSLDLRRANIVDGPATLQVSVVMGEVKIRVPAEWKVQISNSSHMGEAKDARPDRASHDGAPDLIVNGSVTMGSLQITD